MNTNDARVLAEGLMGQHGLTGWKLVFDRARTRAGVCRFSRREIGLSRVLTELHSADLVRDTILHEIAHALVGQRHGHDAVWRAMALTLGGDGRRCMSESAPRPPAPWMGACSRGHEVSRHRRPARPMACMRCAPTFEVEHVFVWLFHGEPAPLSPAYQAELANLHAARELQAALGTRAVSAGAVLAGTSPAGRLPLGTHVMLGGTSKYAGLDGWIEKRGRSRYVVRTLAGTITAPFGLVRAVER